MAWDGITNPRFLESPAKPVRIEPSSAADDAPAGLAAFGATVWRPSIKSRSGVTYVTCRAWRADAKTSDLAALKKLKCTFDAATVDGMAGDMVAAVRALFGAAFASVSYVTCGHSRRADCLSARLGSGVAAALGAPLVKAFADRFVAGVSHPKQFAQLPPLQLIAQPAAPCLVIDDVATSGFHIREAVLALREAGCAAVGVVWIGGAVATAE